MHLLCKSRSASDIALQMTTFRKLLVYNGSLAILFLYGEQKLFSETCVFGFDRSQSQRIVEQTSEKLNRCDFDARAHAFIAKGGIVCEHRCTYIRRHQAPPCVLLTCLLYGNQDFLASWLKKVLCVCFANIPKLFTSTISASPK